MTDTWTCWRDPTHQPIATTRFGWPRCGACGAAPSYPERWAYAQAADVTVDLYMPVAGTYAAQHVAARSGVVGVPDSDSDQIDTSYEGWLYSRPGEDVHANWKKAVEAATNRLVVNYPTVARSRFPAEQLTRIGLVSVRDGITVDDAMALEAWLNLTGRPGTGGARVPPRP
ncbi:MAG TPA: hypothetical protein VFQ85_07440 [Mycobacteriales bacterium]|jgi:hypothetical protein|nr:hypothetical protein [Mycobacteriales bacterium]